MLKIKNWFDRKSLAFRDAFNCTTLITSAASTLFGLLGLTLFDLFPSIPHWTFWFIVPLAYLAIFSLLYYLIKKTYESVYSTNINSVPVNIKIGNIFEEEGLKLIPCTDTFEMTVDDRVISKSSLNGQLVENGYCDKERLQKYLRDEGFYPGKWEDNRYTSGGKRLDLGSILVFDKYFLLAFTSLNEKAEAHINRGDYEKCLMKMWSDIRTFYNGRDINIPILGGGITTLDSGSKNYTDLLKCMLCTFGRSGIQLNSEVNIIIREQDFEKIDMQKIRREF